MVETLLEPPVTTAPFSPFELNATCHIWQKHTDTRQGKGKPTCFSKGQTESGGASQNLRAAARTARRRLPSLPPRRSAEPAAEEQRLPPARHTHTPPHTNQWLQLVLNLKAAPRSCLLPPAAIDLPGGTTAPQLPWKMRRWWQCGQEHRDARKRKRLARTHAHAHTRTPAKKPKWQWCWVFCFLQSEGL